MTSEAEVLLLGRRRRRVVLHKLHTRKIPSNSRVFRSCTCACYYYSVLAFVVVERFQ